MIKPITNWRGFVLLPLSLFVVSCSWMGNDFRDRGNDYLLAEPIKPIVVPSKYNANSLEELYVVPTLQTDDFDLTEAFETPRPEALATSNFEESVKIQKLGAKRWILMNSPPSEVWPRIRNFLAANKVAVADSDAVAGTIDSAWLQFKDSPEVRDRYRVYVEQGVQPDSTEIHIRHDAANVSNTVSSSEWPELSINPEREAWMLDELAATLASEASTGSASLLAQGIGGGPKISVKMLAGEPVLRMALSYERARATIAHALRQQGFTTFDLEIDNGIFYVGYEKPVNPDEESWYTRWFGGASEAVIPTTPYSLSELLANLQVPDSPEARAIFPGVKAFGVGEKLTEIPGYLVVVLATEAQVDIRIRDGYGNRLNKREAKEKLSIIRRNLI